MKIFIPKHIKGGVFGMPISMGPINISIVQLLICGFGLAVTLGTWNAMVQGGLDKSVAGILVSPAAIITLFVAFFNMTEMNLAEFLVKVFRTYFLDEPRKFQVNYAKMDPIKIRIADIKSQEVKQTVVEKKAIDKTKLQDLDSII